MQSNLFANCITKYIKIGLFPKIWKEAIVIPISKPGKDKSKATNYRPISLTYNLCKLLEKIINKRLKTNLEERFILKPE